tara:strand:- start:216 stop:929 length:714 start_codon:yes stop_codon:yes gene_type:complete
MGGYNSYDILIDNPSNIFPSEELEPRIKKYLWNTKLRVITPSGKITGIGTDDGYGNVTVGKKTYNIIYCEKLIGYKNKYSCSYINEEVNSNKGLMIHDIVYKYLKEHKLYSKLKSNYNIYDALIKFVSNPKRDTGLMGKYRNSQDVFIESENFKPESQPQEEFDMIRKIRGVTIAKMKKLGWEKINENEWIHVNKDTIIENKNDSMLVDPKINAENKERIQKLVDLFIKYTLSTKKK